MDKNICKKLLHGQKKEKREGCPMGETLQRCIMSQVIIFKETLEFKDTINVYYSKQAFPLQNTIPSF
jgi:hypothetical protein